MPLIPTRLKSSHATALAVAFATTLLATSASAQTVELTQTQRSYNDQGVAALASDDYSTAISSFEASLTMGAANIIFLNLGRAFQRSGQCLRAKQTYAKVADAPVVAAPTKAEVDAVLAKFQAELPQVCPSSVTVTCPQSSMVTIDAGQPKQCDDQLEIEVQPGTHDIAARDLDGRVFNTSRDIGEGESVEVVVQFPEPESDPVPPEPVAEQPPPTPLPSEPAVAAEAAPDTPRRSSPIRVVGATIAGVGTAALVTGLILDATFVRSAVNACNDGPCTPDQHDEAKSRRALNAPILIGGTGLLAVGAVLYLVGGSSKDRGGVSLMFSDGPGLAYTVGF